MRSGTRSCDGTTAHPTNLPGIRIHQTRSLDAADVTILHGVPVTTVARTLVDLAGAVPHDQLVRAGKQAERQRIFDLNAVEEPMARTRGRIGPGHRALREAIAECAAFAGDVTRSALEEAFLRLVRRHGLPWPSTNALVEGLEGDAVWRTERVAVELDGWQDHRTRHAFQRDRERDAALTAAGWRVVRFTHHDVTRRPDRVTETLRRLGIR
jgi:very-short-patch-repair endonuclease